MAFNEFILILFEGKSFRNVAESTTIDIPDVDTCLSWKRLSTKYEPYTVNSLVLLKKEFNKCLQNKNNYPDE